MNKKGRGKSLMKKILKLALAGLMLIGLVGCGSNDDNKGKNQSNSTVVVAVPSFGGNFIYGWGTSSYDAFVRYLVYGQNGLLTVDQNGGMIKNFFVEDFEVSEDNLTWSFQLKKGIKYSDGTELTAKDVLFTYKFYLDDSYLTAGGSGATPRIDNITGAKDYLASCEAGACDDSLLTGITVVDDYNIEFNLDVCYFATWYNTFGYTPILSEAHFTQWDGSIDADGSVNIEVIKKNAMEEPFGMGPYKFVEYEPSQYIRLEINEHYVEDAVGQKPSINTIIMKITADELELDQLLVGDLDILPGEIDEEKIDPIKADANFAANAYPRHGYGVLTLHTDFGVTQYKEVRQAISYAMNREEFAEMFMGKYGSVVQGPYSTNFWMIDDAWVEETLIDYHYNPEKVKEILEDAGWARGDDGIYAKDGEKLVITVACGTQKWADSLNLLTAKVAEECGIQFVMVSIDFQILMDHMTGLYLGSESDRIYNGFCHATSLDAVFDGYATYHSRMVNTWGGTQTGNNPRLQNAEVDALIEAMRLCNPATEEGKAEYQRLYREWLIILNEEAPILPMYSNEYHDLYSAHIKNFYTSSLWDWTNGIIGATID